MSKQEQAAAATTEVKENTESSNTVPMEVVKSLREELKSAKGLNTELTAALQQQATAFQGNMAGAAPPPPEPEVDPDEVITMGQFQKMMQKTMGPLVAQLQETKASGRFTDFEAVVKEGLPIALQNDPSLREAIRSSNDPYTLSYRIAKAEVASKAAANSANEADDLSAEELAAKAAENAKKPGTVDNAANVGGGLADVNKYATMSDEEFAASVEKVKMGS
jgi:hypothetical protein